MLKLLPWRRSSHQAQTLTLTHKTQFLCASPLPSLHRRSAYHSRSSSEDAYDPPFSPICQPTKPKPNPQKDTNKRKNTNTNKNNSPRNKEAASGCKQALASIPAFPAKSDLPFDFRYSYSETNPAVLPISFRESPKFSPFGPGRLDRKWTGTCAPVGDGADLEKWAEQRKAVLGDPLCEEEVVDLLERYRYNNCARQINLGRGGVTHNMLDDIHNHWKKAEAVRIKCFGVPTLDLDNVCFHLEDKSGGSIIARHVNVLVLYRGRNYDPKSRPAIPLMLWKPYPPIYPRLVKNVADGLTFKETNAMRSKGLNSPHLLKLMRNGVYVNVVKKVREAFKTEEVVRLDCRYVGTSDCKRIGAKLRDLVPCVPILFKDEQIILWRGKTDQEHNSNQSVDLTSSHME